MSDRSNNEGPFTSNSGNKAESHGQAGNSSVPEQQTQNQYKEQATSYQSEQHSLNQTYAQQPSHQQTPHNNDNQAQYNHGQYSQGQFDQGQYNQAQYNQAQYNQTQYNQTQYNQGQYGQYPPPPVGGHPYQQPMYLPKKTNTKSIVGLILGIASIVLPYIGFFIGIAGIIVNAISLKEIKRTHEDGKGLAIGGLVTSILGTALYLIIILFLIFVFAIVAETNNYYY